MKTRWVMMVLAALLVLAVAHPVRDPNGRIHRSHAAVHRFEVATGHPHGWKGHIVDHIVPLADGGPDDPINMQWMTVRDAKAKDLVERFPAELVKERAELEARRSAPHVSRMR